MKDREGIFAFKHASIGQDYRYEMDAGVAK